MYNTIQIVINTLNQIEVKGKANMDRLLGAILTLESVAANLSKQNESNKDEEDPE